MGEERSCSVGHVDPSDLNANLTEGVMLARKEVAQRAGEFWNKKAAAPSVPQSRWWMCPPIIQHINKLVCGEPINGIHAGFHRELALRRGSSVGPRRAISVGCGDGSKEISLVQSGLIDKFDLFEVSTDRITKGQTKVKTLGLENRVFFHHEDALETDQKHYDLVYWNNALHHMPDVRMALEWSHSRLREGGLFAMDDFVGPSRFQWTDEMLAYCNLVRGWLSDRYFVNPLNSRRPISKIVTRPTIEAMIASDPSEAADSGNIIPALKDIFPSAHIQPTGGVIYHTGLNDVLANLDVEKDQRFLFAALALDKALADIGENQYAVAFATK
jgi:SAM-dependent methyltransferase